MPSLEINKPKPIAYLVLIIFFLISLAGNVFFGLWNAQMQKDLRLIKSELEAKNNNIGIINFTEMLVRDVLSSDNEVSFETRLQLENAVRELDDVEILDQWKKFTESAVEVQAQMEVKKLLKILLSKATSI